MSRTLATLLLLGAISIDPALAAPASPRSPARAVDEPGAPATAPAPRVPGVPAPPTAAPAPASTGAPVGAEHRFDALRIDAEQRGPAVLEVRGLGSTGRAPLLRLRRSFLHRIFATMEAPGLHAP